MSGFDIGNVYSSNDKGRKTYYVAVRQKTLITCKNGNFGQYTVAKKRHVLESNVSVRDLCTYWEIQMKQFDDYMSKHFGPDEEAKNRVLKEKVS